jgi:phosphomannomutase/phosphoglucomutase
VSNKRLFGTNGIRGIVNQEMTPEFVVKVGTAIGTYFGNRDIIVGYDSRTSNAIMSRAVMAGLASTGCNVLDGGQAPTPAIQYAVKHFKLGGAVIVTASHNPPEYNGIKVVSDDGVEIGYKDELKIEATFFNEQLARASWNQLGGISPFPNIIKTYTNAIKTHIDIDAIKKQRFKVIIDPVNSVGGLVTPYLLKELGCKVITINAQIDGVFSRMPEPTPESLEELSIMVHALNADLGVAHDGDADRCMFVNELGRVVWGDKTGAIIIEHLLRKLGDCTVVTPISSSRLLEEVVQRQGSQLIWTKVGSTVITKKMQAIDAEIGFEDNGGLFYAPHQPVRDGALAACLMLEVLASQREPLSKLVSELPEYFLVKKRIECSQTLKSKVLPKLLDETKTLNRLTLDGVKIFFDDATVLIRPSGTEAVYRVYAEAKEAEKADEIAEWGVSLVNNALKQLS